MCFQSQCMNIKIIETCLEEYQIMIRKVKTEFASKIQKFKEFKKLIKEKSASFFTGEIRLADFLNDLLINNSEVLKNCDEHQFFENANISFTRFVTIRTIPTLNDVKNGYNSCVAFNLKRNHQGADFLIPVKCNEQTYTVFSFFRAAICFLC